jgi:hypothetical protein
VTGSKSLLDESDNEKVIVLGAMPGATGLASFETWVWTKDQWKEIPDTRLCLGVDFAGAPFKLLLLEWGF